MHKEKKINKVFNSSNIQTYVCARDWFCMFVCAAYECVCICIPFKEVMNT